MRHGLSLARGEARLSLRARREGAMLRLEVLNSGPGIAAGAEEGIGLSNTRTGSKQPITMRGSTPAPGDISFVNH